MTGTEWGELVLLLLLAVAAGLTSSGHSVDQLVFPFFSRLSFALLPASWLALASWGASLVWLSSAAYSVFLIWMGQDKPGSFYLPLVVIAARNRKPQFLLNYS